MTHFTRSRTGLAPQLQLTTSIGTELKQTLIIALARTVPSWIHRSKVSSLPFLPATISSHLPTDRSNSKSLLVLIGRFLATVRFGSFPLSPVGKPECGEEITGRLCSSTINSSSFLLVTFFASTMVDS